jgi:hypothetical protein
LLDKQFFQDEQFHPYLTQNFLLFRAHRGKPDGDEVYKKFSVRATPTVLFAMADGREIDRILGYGGKPNEFKESIEKTYKGENTLLNLMQAYEKDSSDVSILARIAEKYHSNNVFDKMAEFSYKILIQPERAKQVKLPFGKDNAEVSVYEFARYAAAYSGPEAVLEFANEFPQGNYINDVFGDFWRALKLDPDYKAAKDALEKLNETKEYFI